MQTFSGMDTWYLKRFADMLRFVNMSRYVEMLGYEDMPRYAYGLCAELGIC
jgi:hypothetical protein